ncbi:MAG: M15 family metallopeptidase [Pseudomonadota bacterium]
MAASGQVLHMPEAERQRYPGVEMDRDEDPIAGRTEQKRQQKPGGIARRHLLRIGGIAAAAALVTVAAQHRYGGRPPPGSPLYRWPAESRGQDDLFRVYGDPRDNSQLTLVRTPWPLQLAWKPEEYRREVIAHRRVADSLGEVFERVHAHYGEKEIRRLRLDQFGGDHVDRAMRGARDGRWSTHAWGIAFDFDPLRNQLRWGREKASLASADYRDWWQIWEEQGWYSLGRNRDFDWMHVQAAWRAY